MAVIATVRDEAGDPRVAITPATAAQLVKAGHEVLVTKGVGAGAGFEDAAYTEVGASVVTPTDALSKAQVLVSVGRPAASALSKLSAGTVLIAQLDSWGDTAALDKAAARGAHLIALEKVPRQISRAQSMDTLTSQASIAGYRAGIIAAHTYGRYFPMMVTAAGTAKPATVLVLGAGVAGLQAIATARRLGARVSGYDVRPAAREEVTSMGAAFLETSVNAVGEGGYARELTKEEAATQQRELSEAIATFDVVISTAKVPGRKPPLLVTKETVAAMRGGSVIVDLAASDKGGNVAGSVDGETVVTKNGVVIIGAGGIAADMAPAASDAYARNVLAVVNAIVIDGEVVVDAADDVIGAMLIGTKEDVA
jgi:NAD(P) transhydrogenase subunit alpha